MNFTVPEFGQFSMVDVIPSTRHLKYPSMLFRSSNNIRDCIP
jgi:hypothetical protein